MVFGDGNTVDRITNINSQTIKVDGRQLSFRDIFKTYDRLIICHLNPSWTEVRVPGRVLRARYPKSGDAYYTSKHLYGIEVA